MSQNFPDLKTLRRLRPLQQFTDEQLQSLANQLSVQTAKKKQVLIELGSSEEFSLYVLQGNVNLTARDGAVKSLTFGEQDELNPIAQLRPSMFEVTAAGAVEYLRIDKNFLNEFARQSETGDEDISVHMIDTDSEMNPLTVHLYQDLMLDKISLPSLPQVALRIQQVFKDENVDADKLACAILTDPAITSKLIKVANSPVYQGVAATETLQAAIVRLGMQTTYKQVMAYAVNELFQSASPKIARRMEEVSAHSRKVAAISRILAKRTGLFDHEQAMLAGLIHDLGVIVIVEYLHKYAEQIHDNDMIEKTINMLRPQITGMLMKKWNFADDMVTVAEESEEWFRNPRDEVDLCDLVLVAQFHSLMGTAEMQNMPPISMIPAMAKLNMGPQESIELIRQSNREIAEIEKMLQ
jgi:HD-like signal output (HDOD) protein